MYNLYIKMGKNILIYFFDDCYVIHNIHVMNV